MSTKHHSLSLGIAFLALTLAGCGGSGGASDEELVKATVDSYYQAYNVGNGQKACGYMTSTAQNELVRFYGSIGGSYADCEAAVDSNEGEVDPSLVATAEEVVVTGDEAIATLGFTGNEVPLEKVDDRWLISRMP